tara:strand:- start:101 stop:838 length:738 start_codon:yes stop_codon:yes gene_type:complete
LIVVGLVGGAGLLGQAFLNAASKNPNIELIWCDQSQLDVKLGFRVTVGETVQQSIANINNFALEEFNKVPDFFFNCSYPRLTGKIDSNHLEEQTIDYVSSLASVQIQNVVEFNLAAYREYLAHNAKGSIISVGSIYGSMPPDFSIYEGTDKDVPLSYAISKASLIQIVRFLAKRYVKSGITFNVISFGGISGTENTQFKVAYGKRVSSGSMIPPTDCGFVLTSLCSDFSKHLNGQNIIIDGGFSL